MMSNWFKCSRSISIPAIWKLYYLRLKIFGAEEEQDLEMAALTTDGANLMDGTRMKNGESNTSRTESPAAGSKVLGKKKYRSRSASASSQDSYSSGSYTGKATARGHTQVQLQHLKSYTGTVQILLWFIHRYSYSLGS